MDDRTPSDGLPPPEVAAAPGRPPGHPLEQEVARLRWEQARLTEDLATAWPLLAASL